MKNRKKNARQRELHALKKSQNIRNALWILVFIVITMMSTYYILTPQTLKKSEPEIESYIRSLVTQEDITPQFQPGIIYYKKPGMNKELFCCVGTLFHDTKLGAQIVTAEHVFRTDTKTPQILSVSSLRKKMEPTTVYFNDIVASGRMLGSQTRDDRDITIATLGTKPIAIEPYSHFNDGELNQNFWGEVIIGKTKIPRLRSILSGEYVYTIGYVHSGETTNGANFVLIDRISRRGESGTGFIDDHGGLWVLHGTPEDEIARASIREECLKFTGKKIKGATTVSGPLFLGKDRYD